MENMEPSFKMANKLTFHLYTAHASDLNWLIIENCVSLLNISITLVHRITCNQTAEILMATFTMTLPHFTQTFDNVVKYLCDTILEIR